MADTITRIDDLERRVARVERHLGFAPTVCNAGVHHGGVERSVNLDSSSAPAQEWEAIIEPRARAQSPSRTRRELLNEFLRDVPPSPAVAVPVPIAPAPAPT